MEVLKGGLDADTIEIALDRAEERFSEARQMLAEAAYGAESVSAEVLDGQKPAEDRKVVNRLALKALELLNWHIKDLMVSLQTQKSLSSGIDKKWVKKTRELLSEFCRHGLATPVQREEASVRPATAAFSFSALLKWAFGRETGLPRQI